MITNRLSGFCSSVVSIGYVHEVAELPVSFFLADEFSGGSDERRYR